jgi:uncharacterized protein (DUF58 family)
MSVHRIEIDDLIALRREAANIDLSSRRRVMTDLVGAHVSGFRGRGMDFEEHRAYQPGDEARTIDWRVTARTGKLHVRLYREERERPVLLAVDLRPPMWFGTRGCYKAVLAARAAALCAWSAVANGDRIGGLSFGRKGHTEIRAAGGPRGALKLLHSLEGDTPLETNTVLGEFADAIQRLLRTTRPGSLVGLFSDFRDMGKLEADLLRRLASRAELVVGFVHDPLEAELPPPGLYPVSGRAGAAPLLLDTGRKQARARWREAFHARRGAAQGLARGSGAHWLDLNTATPLLDSFALAFGRRRSAA